MMMKREDSKPTKAVVGVYGYFDDLIAAAKALKESGAQYRIYSPFAHHEIEDVSMPGKSPVRFVTAVGALLGLTFGFSLPILCSLDYPLRVSAKDIVSVPGFVVIGYECTILFGGIFTLMALMHFCRLPDIFRKVGYDPRFSDNKFGLVVGCSPDEVDELRTSLKNFGAEEVEVRDAL